MGNQYLNRNLNLIRELIFIPLVTIVIITGCSVETERPNVLFIMSDDHTSQAISAYGGMLKDVCPTPNIDRLANEGMLFNNCFVTNSICTPSRAAIFTGKYAHKNGVYKFTALDQSQPILPKLMNQEGYNTAIIGKYHLASNPVGFDYFSVLPGQGAYHDPVFIKKGDEHPNGYITQGKRTQYKGHSSDVIADQTLDFLKNKREEDKPFMLFCHFKAPHDTWEFAERYSDFLADIEIPEPSSLFDDYKNRPALQKTLQYIGSEWGDHTNFEDETAKLEDVAKKKMQYQLYMKKYLRCVKGVDDNVGRILDYLDETGLAENTIVIYTGDQGFFLGEHGLYDKRFMYEEALRMPFLVRWPDKIKKNTHSDGMILNVDFAPTILEAAAINPHPEMQGASFLQLLNGNVPSDWRNSMYYRYYYSHFETEPHYGVRTYKHKLIHYDRINEWELYDLEKDPYEMNNSYDDPEYDNIVQELKTELNRLQKDLGDDPNDVGDKPNIGSLAPAPLHVDENIDLGDGNISVLIKFRSKHGGTLFSICDLKNDPEFMGWDGMKTLFIDGSSLSYMDSDDPEKFDIAVNDDRWHTVAVVYRGGQPNIYIDGEFRFSSKFSLTPAQKSSTFNVGAGLDEGGWLGYNFTGDIANVMVYDEPLNNDKISEYAEGRIPKGKVILDWINVN